VISQLHMRYVFLSAQIKDSCRASCRASCTLVNEVTKLLLNPLLKLYQTGSKCAGGLAHDASFFCLKYFLHSKNTILIPRSQTISGLIRFMENLPHQLHFILPLFSSSSHSFYLLLSSYLWDSRRGGGGPIGPLPSFFRPLLPPSLLLFPWSFLR
jgi:hypothetical protein